ncbi:MAG: hypothetical protein GF307_03865 [candidate division Zixibacteria bacterium]|nr:hypothetical protein [candidate division Zixibacteria bacterium]
MEQMGKSLAGFVRFRGRIHNSGRIPRGIITRGISLAFFSILILFISGGCSSKGLLSEKHSPDYYRVPKLMSDDMTNVNPTFIAYGDPQAGWRIKEKFIHRHNWATWKMLIFPFYELYWLGNGVAGAVDGIRMNATYGAEYRRIMRETIYRQAKVSDADFILCLGDISAGDGRRHDHWELFLDENKHHGKILDEFPYLPTIGNHERANDIDYGWTNYSDVFGYPRFYKVEFKDAVLLITDSNFILDQKSHIDNKKQDSLFNEWFVSDGNSSKKAWLEHELASAGDKFKIVSIHHPPVTFGQHYTDWYDQSYGNDLLEKRRKLIGLFERENVQLVLSGHEHYYQHNILNYDSNDQNRAIHFVVSSGGGVPLREAPSESAISKRLEEYERQGYDIGVVKQESVFHYTVIDVAENTLSVKTYEVPEKPGNSITLLDDLLIRKLASENRIP